MNPHDERLNLPSASRFEMLAACEGQPQLERRLREQGLIGEEAPDEFALRGTRIHKAWETGDTSGLTDDELEDIGKTHSLDTRALGDWLAEKFTDSHGVLAEKGSKEFSEQRLWLKDSEGNQLCSGQFDKLTIVGNHAYCRDLKSGWSRRLTPSQQSWQLRLLAVLVWLEYGPKHSLETVRASFIKPKLRHGVDTVEYSIEDLQRSLMSIRQILWRSEQHDAARRAGDHCYYCVCRAQCPEAGAMTVLPTVVATRALNATQILSRKEATAAVEQLGPMDWKAIWQRSTVIRNILEAVNAKLKSLPPEELSQLGLQLGKGKRLDPITNTEGAYTVLRHTIPKSIWSCLKFSKDAIVEALKNEKGMSEADAKAWMKANLDLFIEPKESDGSLEEV